DVIADAAPRDADGPAGPGATPAGAHTHTGGRTAAGPSAAPQPEHQGDAIPPYDRAQWPHWIDADGDCQDTRTEVLIEESEIAVEFTDARRCEVARGRWRCPYTDRTITDPRQLDIDHTVPLAYAHAHGAAGWTRAQRTAYANDLSDPDHLVAVLARANRAKGSRGLDAWLPEEPGSRCAYVDAWLRIEARWQLRGDAAERTAVAAAQQACRDGGVPERPRAHGGDRPGATDPGAAPGNAADPSPPRACCRVCKKGKPCGDACIAADHQCHAPPGCACGP
ncbi:MAG: hypothetical protein K1X88_36090, partial [Nannocystaceae bacterium]|nr:hypothetical protein [Nannocystaceae bacterium]